jgi:hypothetical protein
VRWRQHPALEQARGSQSVQLRASVTAHPAPSGARPRAHRGTASRSARPSSRLRGRLPGCSANVSSPPASRSARQSSALRRRRDSPGCLATASSRCGGRRPRRANAGGGAGSRPARDALQLARGGAIRARRDELATPPLHGPAGVACLAASAASSPCVAWRPHALTSQSRSRRHHNPPARSAPSGTHGGRAILVRPTSQRGGSSRHGSTIAGILCCR